jgi:micrococcal nuclease
MYQYKAKILNIVDGDTFDVDIDLGFNIHIHERVRLLNVDTPEKFGVEKPLGMIMKEYAINNFLNKEIVIRSEKNTEAAETDSFGRWLIETTLDDGQSISQIYKDLGVNKLFENYSEENVLKLIQDKTI